MQCRGSLPRKQLRSKGSHGPQRPPQAEAVAPEPLGAAAAALDWQPEKRLRPLRPRPQERRTPRAARRARVLPRRRRPAASTGGKTRAPEVHDAAAACTYLTWRYVGRADVLIVIDDEALALSEEVPETAKAWRAAARSRFQRRARPGAQAAAGHFVEGRFHRRPQFQAVGVKARERRAVACGFGTLVSSRRARRRAPRATWMRRID